RTWLCYPDVRWRRSRPHRSGTRTGKTRPHFPGYGPRGQRPCKAGLTSCESIDTGVCIHGNTVREDCVAPEKSGLNYPNKIARIYINAREDVRGKSGLNAILTLAHLNQFIDNYPADNLERQFDFAYFTALNAALEDMYGPRGGRGLALRA